MFTRGRKQFVLKRLATPSIFLSSCPSFQARSAFGEMRAFHCGQGYVVAFIFIGGNNNIIRHFGGLKNVGTILRSKKFHSFGVGRIKKSQQYSDHVTQKVLLTDRDCQVAKNKFHREKE